MPKPRLLARRLIRSAKHADQFSFRKYWYELKTNWITAANRFADMFYCGGYLALPPDAESVPSRLVEIMTGSDPPSAEVRTKIGTRRRELS